MGMMLRVVVAAALGGLLTAAAAGVVLATWNGVHLRRQPAQDQALRVAAALISRFSDVDDPTDMMLSLSAARAEIASPYCSVCGRIRQGAMPDAAWERLMCEYADHIDDIADRLPEREMSTACA